MRTTIDLPDTLFHQIKILTAQQRTSLKDFLIRAAEQELVRAGTGSKRSEVRLPLVPTRQPGALKSLTNADIDDLPG